MDEHSSVRMLRESVSVKLYPDCARVRCQFIFRNEGKPTRVKMGFPESGWGDISTPKESRFKYFRSWVDGRPVGTRFALPKNQKREEGYRAWHLKDVYFRAGQTRTIVDEYQCNVGANSDGSRFFNYILTTGRSWKGTIGGAVITVDTSALARYWVVEAISPKGYVTGRQKIIWRMRDFEPSEDISIGLDIKRPILNGKQVSGFEYPYYVEDGVPMMPVKVLADHGLAKVAWDAKRRTCTVSRGGRLLVMSRGSRTAILNGVQTFRLPRVPSGRGYFIVPIATVVKALGGTATYDRSGVLHLNLR
jgi:hypothetical protein